MDRRAAGGAELLEIERQDADRARDVAGILLQSRRFLEIVENELVDAEVRSQLGRGGHVVGRNLVEIAREPVTPSLRVTHHLARLQDRAHLVVEVERIDHLENLSVGSDATQTYSPPGC